MSHTRSPRVAVLLNQGTDSRAMQAGRRRFSRIDKRVKVCDNPLLTVVVTTRETLEELDKLPAAGGIAGLSSSGPPCDGSTWPAALTCLSHGNAC